MDLSLILLTILDLKMRTLLYLIGLYALNLKTPLVIRPSISYLSNAWNRAPGVIIRPLLRSCKASWKSAFSLAVINTINSLVLFSIVIRNYSLKSTSRRRFRDPFGRSLPRSGCGTSTIIVSELFSWSSSGTFSCGSRKGSCDFRSSCGSCWSCNGP